ncbi:hypothetical protein SAMN04487947_1640 [Halogeometricum rufum]|uniref:Uncharacterized protein n=2 Tax=Halogeometricum TaxID=60846 RepID=A0A1I6GTM5_9EURY|nr:hypothetical protein [Halogeometricum rufum]SFR45562.1 hypothetical protein SAMN04487947_1640 [Halogeometricum rufum]
MNNFDSFNRKETEYGTFVIAQPKTTTGDKEPVRLEASIVERNEDEDMVGNWEPVIGEMVGARLGDVLSMDEAGSASLSRTDVVEAVTESDNTSTTTEWESEALVEFFASENILDVEGKEVTVLSALDDVESTDAPMINNWAATVDACANRIETAVEQVEKAKERLEERGSDQNRREIIEKNQQKANEYKQEIGALLDGRLPSDLPPEEHERFVDLREKYHTYENNVTAMENEITDATKTEQLGDVIEQLEHLQEVLSVKSNEMRELVVQKNTDITGVLDQLDALKNLVSTIGNTVPTETHMQEQSGDEFAEDLFGSETFQQTTEDAETLQTGGSLAEQATVAEEVN